MTWVEEFVSWLKVIIRAAHQLSPVEFHLCLSGDTSPYLSVSRLSCLLLSLEPHFALLRLIASTPPSRVLSLSIPLAGSSSDSLASIVGGLDSRTGWAVWGWLVSLRWLCLPFLLAFVGSADAVVSTARAGRVFLCQLGSRVSGWGLTGFRVSS